MFYGQSKVQEIMANFTPPLMGLGSLVVVTIGSLQEPLATTTTYTNDFLGKH
jgi:hypothetical protein